MEFRRNASERRRRVLIEESLQEENGSSAAALRSRQQETPWQNYAAGALRKNQPHVTDVLPKRRFTLAVLALTGLALIAGLLALYGTFYVQPTNWDLQAPAAFDLARADSLANWLASAWLGCGTLLAVIVYLMRRHRVDDYRGRYRIWIWLAALLLLASVETIVGLRHALAEMICTWKWIGERLTEESTVVILIGSVALAALVRGAIEVRRSRGAGLLLLVAFAGYCAVALNGLLAFLPACELRTIIDSTALLMGHYGLTGCLLIYARYVYLDAHGCLPARQPTPAESTKKKRRTKKKEQPQDVAGESSATESRRRSDLEQTEPEKKLGATITAAAAPAATMASKTAASKAAASKAAAGNVVRVDPSHEPAGVGAGGERKLSKAERKKLKRLAG